MTDKEHDLIKDLQRMRACHIGDLGGRDIRVIADALLYLVLKESKK